MESIPLEQRAKIAASLRGIAHTVERRLNISRAHIGQKPWNKGIKTGPQSELTKQKRNQSLLKYRRKGVDNHFWKGGITPLNKAIRASAKYQEWRTLIFLRDGRKCEICGSGKVINADHIMPFSMLIRLHTLKTLAEAFLCQPLWDLSNGRTLCEECHKKTMTHGSNRHKLDKMADKFKEVLCQLSQPKSA